MFKNSRRKFIQLASAPLVLSASGFKWPAQAQESAQIIKSHGISTFGDLKYSADFKHLDYVNIDAPKGGEISFFGGDQFDSLNPYILKGNPPNSNSVPLGAQFSTLMSGTLDEPDALYGEVAHMIEYPENRKWAIFHLRDTAHFWDGTPITAHDVAFSIETLRTKGQPGYQVFLADLGVVEALDDHTVKFTFADDAAFREAPITAAGLPIFSKAYYEAHDFAEPTLTPPLGSGPYKIIDIVPNRRIVFERVEEYWGNELPINKGQMNFNRLRYEFFADSTAAFEGFKAGAYAFRQENVSSIWAEQYNFSAIKDGSVKKEELPDGNPTGRQGYLFNMRKEKFQDSRVREAISLMFNFEWSNKALFFGLYKRTDSFWENTDMQAEGMASPEELALLEPLKGSIPDEVFTEPAYSPPVSGEQQLDRKLFRKASQLLDEAGWEVGADGFRVNASGEVLDFEFMTIPSPATERIITPFLANVDRLGIKTTLSRVDAAQYEERTKRFDYDMISIAYVIELTPGTIIKRIFSSQNADVEGGGNLAGLKSEGVDKLIRIVQDAKTRDDLKIAVRALDRVLRAYKIWVPNFYNPNDWIAYFDYFERPETLPQFGLGVTSIWWANEEKYKKLKDAGVL